MKQQERKKLIMYSVFAWGGPFMLAIICGIVEFVPGVPKSLPRPEFDPNFMCWFSNTTAYLLYFYGIETISIIISICLSICMARKIAHYEKEIAHYMRDSETRRYNDNEQWFYLYLEVTKVLFIIVCIKLYMYTIFRLFNEKNSFAWFTFIAIQFLEKFCICMIFVWKRKIKLLLLKRFGWQNRET